jgi:hypothetical protein
MANNKIKDTAEVGMNENQIEKMYSLHNPQDIKIISGPI